MASPSAEIFQKVRDAVNIVDVVGEHVALKRAGKEFKGLCPFHDDHKPSMAVVPQKQIFHCFVCGMGGDVFKFIREYHKMSAGEALRLLAQKAGIKLPEFRPRSGEKLEGPSVREQIAQTNEWACAFFEKHLRSADGKAGLEYLHSRGLTDETISQFRLGMAPDSWTGMVNAALRGGITTDQLDQAGLVKKRADGSAYDLFRNRVIFPIMDSTSGGGRVIGFGGRVLVEKRDDQGIVVEAKYLNTPETRLFNKSESIYGLNRARPQIIRTRTAVVVEGYMDVIACHQVGVTNVIATLGTALTAEHSRVLKNYAQSIVLVFDSDDAGRRAADRAMEVFVRTPLDIRIASVPDGKDPCDFCMKHGGPAFQKIVDGGIDAITFKWHSLRTQFERSDSVTARQDAINEFLRFTAASVETRGGLDNIDPIRRGQLIVKLSSVVGLPIPEIASLLQQHTKLKPVRSPQQVIASAPAATATDKSEVMLNAQVRAERDVIGFITHIPELYDDVREEMSLQLFTIEVAKAEIFIEYFENTAPSDRSAAGFCSFGDEKENADPLIRAIVSWERAAARWEDLDEFSAATGKMIENLRKDHGHTPKKVVTDCMQYLIDAQEKRMRLFKRNSKFDGLSLEDHFEEIAYIKSQTIAGKSVGKVG